MGRNELIHILADIKTSNWLATGCRLDMDPRVMWDFHVSRSRPFNMKMLKSQIKHTTIHDSKLERIIASYGLR